MTAIDKIRTAFTVAKQTVQELTAADAAKPDVVEARREELKAMNKADLIDLVLTLEAPKKEKGVTVNEMVEAIKVKPECACLTSEQIAAVITSVQPERKTTGKSVASIICKSDRKAEFVPTEKLKIDLASVVNG